MRILPACIRTLARASEPTRPADRHPLLAPCALDGADPQRFLVGPGEHQFVDLTVLEETAYRYTLVTLFSSGAERAAAPVMVTARAIIAATCALPAYPNPANPDIWLPFELAESSPVEVLIYDLLGQRVRRLDLGWRERGRYAGTDAAAHWDACDESGTPVSTGVYIYVFGAGDVQVTRRLTVLR